MDTGKVKEISIYHFCLLAYTISSSLSESAERGKKRKSEKFTLQRNPKKKVFLIKQDFVKGENMPDIFHWFLGENLSSLDIQSLSCWIWF